MVILKKEHSCMSLIVTSLSDLRYIIPFSCAVNRLFPDIEQVIELRRNVAKYNGLALDKNFKLCESILRTHASFTRMGDASSCSIVVCVEVVDVAPDVKPIALQHGFDCIELFPRLSGVSSYVCSSNVSYVCAKGLVDGSVLAPYPVIAWDVAIDDVAVSDALITVFYPDKNDAIIADGLIDDLLRRGYDVVVKQRRKHQPISSAGRHIYDDVWYPSEGVILPISSRLTIGFGSTAYADLTALGVNYVNVDIRHRESPWSSFPHPDVNNYFRVTELDQLGSTLQKALAHEMSRRPRSDELIKQFILQLMHNACDGDCSK